MNISMQVKHFTQKLKTTLFSKIKIKQALVFRCQVSPADLHNNFRLILAAAFRVHRIFMKLHNSYTVNLLLAFRFNNRAQLFTRYGLLLNGNANSMGKE